MEIAPYAQKPVLINSQEECIGWVCKTVYTSSILVVASNSTP
jgi:hypothetical protein